jgi:probable rRNA maturation factor
MDIQIQNRQSTQSLPLPSIRLFLEKCLESLGLCEAELSVLFVSDSEIRQLNRQYRDLDRSTDVLAFSMREGEDTQINPGVLGDIVISAETAQRQGDEIGWGLEKEIFKLLIHGLLHLIGYDHETDPAQAARMQQKEDQIIVEVTG